MKEVNEELEGNTPVWDSNLGRWIEPDEVLDNPEPVLNNATTETDGVDWKALAISRYERMTELEYENYKLLKSKLNL